MASSVAISAPNAVLGIPRTVWGINSGVTEATDSTCSCTGWTFARGDGVTTEFELPSLVSTMNTLYRRDWQGAVALSPSPRTNYHPYSETFSNDGWVLQGTATKTLNQPGPDGGTTACLVSGIGAAGSGMYCYATTGITTGNRYEPGFWIKRVSASGVVYYQNPQTSSAGRWNINLALLPDAWVCITRTHPAVTIISEFQGNLNGCGSYFWSNSGEGTISFYIDKFQLDKGTTVSPYIPVVGAAPVTVTDYALSGSTLTLAEVPVIGADLSVDADLLPHSSLSFGGK